MTAEGVQKALGKLKEGSLEQRVSSIPSEAFQWLLFPAFMALLVEAVLSDRRRRRESAPALKEERRP